MEAPSCTTHMSSVNCNEVLIRFSCGPQRRENSLNYLGIVLLQVMNQVTTYPSQPLAQLAIHHPSNHRIVVPEDTFQLAREQVIDQVRSQNPTNHPFKDLLAEPFTPSC
ncbi:predicted protein [Chaetomium globosum CBS 148.51]|uniref:Uncharacterized protein n=1 Tax=Chaetomium globosum (strain ATCC 6205 / CBS 148.51 / DSM 1962 / NBRC 6347 / NRRL 1970) TaxID=306901 RepID=Q2HBZ9_CHAGB|nr:uncharacterized protein CHGG_02255 [Chaetomium globosum CBS 148.51]EAQ90320.1 predicted protein [Chaetomium globosum CBS 148.51]